MAIFQLFDQEKDSEYTETFEPVSVGGEEKGGLFSTLITRFCFLLLLIGDLAWFVYNTTLLLLISTLFLLTGGKGKFLSPILRRIARQFLRSTVCALSLMVGLFSPPFGIMIACTYFLMYDKAGMEEVVPASLQAQFKDIFNTDP